MVLLVMRLAENLQDLFYPHSLHPFFSTNIYGTFPDSLVLLHTLHNNMT